MINFSYGKNNTIHRSARLRKALICFGGHFVAGGKLFGGLIVSGGILFSGAYCIGSILFRGAFVLLDFLTGGFMVRGLLSGGFLPGAFDLEPSIGCHLNRKTRSSSAN